MAVGMGKSEQSSGPGWKGFTSGVRLCHACSVHMCHPRSCFMLQPFIDGMSQRGQAEISQFR